MRNPHNPVQTYVILGGGSAGWMAAALLGRILKPTGARVILVESPHVSTVGVGEATVPSFVDFIDILGIDKKDFIAKTQATFKLGIKFTGWNGPDHHYWHPFGNVGAKIDAQPFFQQWLRCWYEGNKTTFTDYAPSAAMAQGNKFYIPDPNKPNNLTRMGYALHFDAVLVAEYLADYARRYKVEHIVSHVAQVHRTADGSIKALQLEDGSQVEGECFIDCSGQRALLLGETLGVGYQDWSDYLPVNAAAVVPSEVAEDFPPYTEAIAELSGWRWRIPLQNRTGNGYVFCDRYCTEQQAKEQLLAGVKEPVLSEPRVLRFITGKRKTMWEKNCVAIGLASGFLEPLESTSIYLVMRALLNFIKLLPSRDFSEPTRREFNRLMDIEYHSLRDFLVMHYSTATRRDSDFWRSWAGRAIPNSLQLKLDLYRCQGRLVHNDLDLFAADSWYAVLSGMGVLPADYDPVVQASNQQRVAQLLIGVESSLQHSVGQLLSHRAYLQQFLSL
ncbi:tryptophan halogenase family protein [uncultured Gilvimarinus sp.]|uniref:tryptophan halogenase family protein n=1 Tax=uncultured Gilvimarinus sp. TaxID=1689143 RepID=UPI0030DB9C46